MDPVRDFFKDAWKMAAGCAAGAFVLSFLVGLIAGNPFGIAFSRAFLFAVLFAALGAGLRAVVKAYLPELGASPAGAVAASPAAPEGRAGGVDIVVEDDEALRRQAYQGGGRSGGAPSEAEDSESEPSEELEAADEESAPEGEAPAVEELSEDLADELPLGAEQMPPSGGARMTPSAAAAGERGRGGPGARAADASEAADLESVEDAQSSEELLSGPVGEDLDALPDIADLDSPAAPRGAAARPMSRVPRPAAGERPEDAVRNLLGGQDPATLARAIRTSLKKDEKG
jgi:hypothetical protein